MRPDLEPHVAVSMTAWCRGCASAPSLSAPASSDWFAAARMPWSGSELRSMMVRLMDREGTSLERGEGLWGQG